MTAHGPSLDSHMSRPLWLAAGLVLLLQGFSLFAPTAVLDGAIQWPDSLDYAPAQMLPLLREQLGAVRLVVGLLVAMPALKLFGITPPISIVLSATAIQLWFMALGLLFLWRALRRSA